MYLGSDTSHTNTHSFTHTIYLMHVLGMWEETCGRRTCENRRGKTSSGLNQGSWSLGTILPRVPLFHHACDYIIVKSKKYKLQEKISTEKKIGSNDNMSRFPIRCNLCSLHIIVINLIFSIFRLMVKWQQLWHILYKDAHLTNLKSIFILCGCTASRKQLSV